MSEATKLKVEFGVPEAGSLLVTLNAGEHCYQFFPSHVPYDSIRELVNALLKILDGYSEAKVHWNDEPVEYEFLFVSKGGNVDFKVYEIIDSVVGRQRDERFAFGGSCYEVLRPFWKSLRDMQSRQSLAGYERQWREPFPEREMIELKHRIKIVLNVPAIESI